MINKVLGQKIAAPSQYDKSILVREERQKNRSQIGLDSNNLPFIGYDIWNCWEVSCLTDYGLPVTAIAKIVYPASSKYIVESKSLKLYFNSFNMTKCGDYADKALVKLKVLAEKDLSELLETKVVIGIFQATNIGFIVPPITNWLTEYEDWENIDYANDGFEYNEYKENPELLQIEENPKGIIVAQAFVTTVLRSNCPVTGAPDAGDAYIYIKGVNPIDKESLLRYIVSFREHKEFHENCVERIYTRLWNKFTPDELFVYCAYVRRGSLDINPLRVSHVDLIPEQLISITSPFVKTLRQ